MPSVFVATKSDLDVVQQRTEIQPIDYCKRLGVSPPVYVSMKNNISANIYHNFVSIAIDPFVVPDYCLIFLTNAFCIRTAATPRVNAQEPSARSGFEVDRCRCNPFSFYLRSLSILQAIRSEV